MTEFGKRDLIAQKQILSYGQKNDDGVNFSILRLSNYTKLRHYSYLWVKFWGLILSGK